MPDSTDLGPGDHGGTFWQDPGPCARSAGNPSEQRLDGPLRALLALTAHEVAPDACDVGVRGGCRQSHSQHVPPRNVGLVRRLGAVGRMLGGPRRDPWSTSRQSGAEAWRVWVASGKWRGPALLACDGSIDTLLAVFAVVTGAPARAHIAEAPMRSGRF
jgi:hypothetical protein